MARAGRRRKPGARYPGGQLRKIADAQERLADAEKRVVMAQPHRRGDKSDLAESALGRFVRDHALRRELFDAALGWATTRQKWLGAMSAPRLRVVERTFGTGADVSFEVIEKWREADLEARAAMQRVAGRDGLAAIVRLAADDLDLRAGADPQVVIAGLLALAVHQGLLPASAMPGAAPAPAARSRIKATRVA